VKRLFFSLRLALEAIIVVVLLNATFLLIGFIETGTGVHIVVGLVGIAFSVFIAVILAMDALRVRFKLNDLDAARFSHSENRAPK
jgi:hypothetical protein